MEGVLYLDGELIMAVDKKDVSKSTTFGELPFTFEVVYGNQDSIQLIIHNGNERIPVKKHQVRERQSNGKRYAVRHI